jgi:hypothetical protein
VHAGPRCPFQRARLRRDGAFRTEVAYCAEKGIPHSEFLARWSNEDRAKLIAHMLDESEKCSLCGTSTWEWVDNPDAYVAMWHDCMGCRHKHAFEDSEGKQNVAGRMVVLKSREEADRIRLNPLAVLVPRLKRRNRPKRSAS